MDSQLQLCIGFDQMKAAVVGGHDLSMAWFEVLDVSMVSAQPMPHAWGGALACLLFCTHALDKAGLLVGFEVPGEYVEFLHAEYADRLNEVTTATDANDFAKIGRLASVMVACVGALRNHLTFVGRLPVAV